jgi:hypothetical protein
MPVHTRSSGSPTTSEDGAVVVPLGKKPQTRWMPEEEDALLQFLFEHKSEMKDNNMFKDPIFREAAQVIGPLRIKGAPKTFKSCKTKWSNVCISFVSVLSVS